MDSQPTVPQKKQLKGFKHQPEAEGDDGDEEQSEGDGEQLGDDGLVSKGRGVAWGQVRFLFMLISLTCIDIFLEEGNSSSSIPHS